MFILERKYLCGGVRHLERDGERCSVESFLDFIPIEANHTSSLAAELPGNNKGFLLARK